MNASGALRRIGERRPLVHHLTNYVTVNLVANATLATGALPVMANAVEEVEEMAATASALVINTGTLDGDWVEAMILAGKEANRRGIPVVLDPVGAGATRFRTETPERLLSEIDFTAVCGNAGEVSALAGLAAEVRGVESIGGDAREAVQKAAGRLGTTVAATGPVDYVCDGERLLAVKNGHALMGRIVGSGCASTAVVGCLAAVGGGDAGTVAGALAYFGLAGEVAAGGAGGPGTFEPRLLDALSALAADPDGLDGRLVVEEVPLA
ncbi:hydroxyethylthiazole kinase [Rubrobacter tropicus]|uniref:Hydroxyethylthiazole kinase n=1 Tax=Rubrobacter tropicus TaxID=2653851 RepID=A0A6G8Q563_9ACTN|nr:hydroxyethylthiazole kinase [Rubrobacter tropicus]QIN81606.1 hydroxyethylthiazole kinase [Rubrobacter tropicus]